MVMGNQPPWSAHLARLPENHGASQEPLSLLWLFVRHTIMLHDMVAQTITKRPAAEGLNGDAAKRAREQRQSLLDLFLRAALAGARAMDAAGTSLISFKGDGTPHAAADIASDLAIRAVLSEGRPDLPVVSEEGARDLPEGFANRPFILVDPLDGTREFMEGHPDHAVCLALVEDRRPVAGVILAPAQRRAWVAGDVAVELALDDALDPVPGQETVLSLDGAVREPLRMATKPFTAGHSGPPALSPRSATPDCSASGPFSKLVAVARGDACVFPTQNPSSEWDIAGRRGAGGARPAARWSAATASR